MRAGTARVWFAFALALLGGASAEAAVVSLHADLDSFQIVTPVLSPAFGSLDATLDDGTGAFNVVAGNYQGLLAGSTSVLLNVGAFGANGAFIMTLTNDTPGQMTGTFSGGGLLTAPQIASMLADSTYVRVTTQTVFPAGEIRGQLRVVPEPSTLALAVLPLVGLIVIGVVWLSRRGA